MAVDFPRQTAIKILYEIFENGAYANIAINKQMKAGNFDETDRAFIAELVYGTVKWKLTIDWVVEQFSTLKIKKISPWILNILRMGVFQLLYMDRVPASAACNESVSLAKKYGHRASSGYVNAVLRKVAEKKDCLTYPDRNEDIAHFLSVRYSHPRWMVEKWIGLFGEEFTESLLEHNNRAPDFTVRTNTLITTREKLIEDLKNNGIDAVKGRYLEEAVVINNPVRALKSEEFKKGHFQVQDESSMLVARVLDPRPGELIMDVCAAPGGKATHIAQIMGNKGIVIARDIYEHKVKLIKQTSERLGLSIVKEELFDATCLDERYVEKADRVLVDAPCTGWGIIRRKPDIKWKSSLEDVDEIKGVQRAILNTVSRYVKHEGILVYSTCTVNPEENMEMVKSFVDENRAFELEDILSFLPEQLAKTAAEDKFLQLFPNVDYTDGFFIARIKKVRKNG